MKIIQKQNITIITQNAHKIPQMRTGAGEKGQKRNKTGTLQKLDVGYSISFILEDVIYD